MSVKKNKKDKKLLQHCQKWKTVNHLIVYTTEHYTVFKKNEVDFMYWHENVWYF